MQQLVGHGCSRAQRAGQKRRSALLWSGLTWWASGSARWRMPPPRRAIPARLNRASAARGWHAELVLRFGAGQDRRHGAARGPPRSWKLDLDAPADTLAACGRARSKHLGFCESGCPDRGNALDPDLPGSALSAPSRPVNREGVAGGRIDLVLSVEQDRRSRRSAWPIPDPARLVLTRWPDTPRVRPARISTSAARRAAPRTKKAAAAALGGARSVTNHRSRSALA